MKSKKKNQKGGTFTEWVFGSKKKNNTVATYPVKKQQNVPEKLTRKEKNNENTRRFLMRSSNPKIKAPIARSRRNKKLYDTDYNSNEGYVKKKESKKVVHIPGKGYSWERE